MQVLFFDVTNKLPMGNARQVPSLNQLLAGSDVVSLHVPENRSTENMIGAAQLAADETGQHSDQRVAARLSISMTWRTHLDNGHLAAPPSTYSRWSPAQTMTSSYRPYASFDNTFLTPHIGGAPWRHRKISAPRSPEKLARYSDNGTSTSSVNFPEVALPTHEGSHRLLHIHHNTPGIAGGDQQVFSRQQPERVRTVPADERGPGYVVIDIDAEYSDMALPPTGWHRGNDSPPGVVLIARGTHFLRPVYAGPARVPTTIRLVSRITAALALP